MLIWVNRTCSERGEVKLVSRDWRDEPLVEFNLLSDRRDLERLMDGFKRMGQAYAHPEMQKLDDPTRFPRRIPIACAGSASCARRTRSSPVLPALLLDGPSAVRNYLFDNVIVEGFKFDQVMNDDEALEAFVRKSTIGVWHASCSCRMGADGDPMAVTDTQGRVRGGISGLRVVDASIFPLVPSANTNFPVLMSAEKIADVMMASYFRGRLRLRLHARRRCLMVGLYLAVFGRYRLRVTLLGGGRRPRGENCDR